MQAQIARDVKEALLKVRRIHSVVNKLPLDRQLGDTAPYSSSDSAPVPVELSQIDEHETETDFTEDDDEDIESESLDESKSKSISAVRIDSVKQLVEDITSLSLKIESNAENSEATNNSMSKEFSSAFDDFGSFTGLTGTSHDNQCSSREILLFEEYPYNFDLDDLLSASPEVLWKTPYGNTYKVILKDEKTVVVMRLKHVVVDKKEFEQQMEILRRLPQNSHVICPLLGYYYSKDEKLLIYDYIAGDSFSRLLHAGRTPLPLDSRLKISLEVAKGIAHIHSFTGGVHGNINSSNVLVTSDFQCCILHFGLNSLFSDSINLSGNKGYQAPEVLRTERLTHKSDVYSFGILLYEMLTTKSPLEYSEYLSWVAIHGKKRFSTLVFDNEISRQADLHSVWSQMMGLALSCVAIEPEWRPSMSEVVLHMGE